MEHLGCNTRGAMRGAQYVGRNTWGAIRGVQYQGWNTWGGRLGHKTRAEPIASGDEVRSARTGARCVPQKILAQK